MSLSWAEIESGIYGNPELSKTSRFQASLMTRLNELVTPGEDFYIGKQSGDTVGFRLVSRITGTATTPLSEFQKIPMTKPTTYDATAVVYRRGIAVPWTGVREDLDRLDVEDTTIHALKEHSARTHNKLISDALIAGRSFCYVATGAATQSITDNGTPSGTAGANYSAYHARRIVNHLVKRNVPYADGSTYHAAVSPTMHMNLMDDVGVNGFVDVKKYASGGAEGVMNGEVGTYMQTRYMVDNDSNSVADGIGTSSLYGSGFFCGLDACREVVVYPMQLLANMNLGGDFGQQKAIAWLSMLTYKTVWIYATHGQGSTLHYTTA